jgi:hypothetical protein
LAPHHERLTLYTITMIARWFSPSYHPVHLCLTWLTFCIIASFFHSRSNGMATDIGSLTQGLGGHVLRLGIRTKWLRKTWGNSCNFFLGAFTFL